MMFLALLSARSICALSFWLTWIATLWTLAADCAPVSALCRHSASTTAASAATAPPRNDTFIFPLLPSGSLARLHGMPAEGQGRAPSLLPVSAQFADFPPLLSSTDSIRLSNKTVRGSLQISFTFSVLIG